MRVLLPRSRPGTPPAAGAVATAASAARGGAFMEQDFLPPVASRLRPLAVEEPRPAGAESGALVQWTPPHAPIQVEEWCLRALHDAIRVPKQTG